MSEPRLLLGDCVERMRDLPDGSVDAIVCDPPYGIEFMGKDWDRPWAITPTQSVGFEGREENLTLPTHRDGRNANCRTCGGRARGAKRCECATPNWDRHPREDMIAFQEWVYAWAVEALRILKPGGHLLAFGGTRTYHRLAAGIEDAGFEIRDCLAWMYGSGFPKSLDVSKAIDKAAGAEREVVGEGAYAARRPASRRVEDGGEAVDWHYGGGDAITAPATDDARAWDGWGTALKPAYEPVVVARKPLAGTVAANVLASGVGAINVDACRIEFLSKADEAESKDDRENYDAPGRWPANVLLSHHEDCVEVGTKRVRTGTASDNSTGLSGEVYGKGATDRTYPGGYADDDGMETVETWDCVEDCPVRILDEQTGELVSGAPGTHRLGENTGTAYGTESREPGTPMVGFGDRGGASRFFYCAKVSRAERNAGLAGFDPLFAPTMGNGIGGKEHDPETATPKRNIHPTVKPIDLMRWLLRLVVPPGGTILDPFLGSGSTGCAAALEGFDFVGIERDPDYLAIAEARIRFWQTNGEQALAAARALDQAETVRAAIAETGQLDLLS